MTSRPWADLVEEDKEVTSNVPGVVIDNSRPWADLVEETQPKGEKKKKNLPPLVRMPWLEKYLGKAEDSPSAPTVARQIAKGVPVAGAFVPQNEEMTEMQKQWPGATAAANASGNILSTAGPIGMVGKATGGLGLGSQVAGHAALGGVTDAADKAVRDPTASAVDILMSGGKGAAWGSVGPILNKIISPGKTDEQLWNSISRKGLEEVKEEARVLFNSGAHTRKQSQDLAKKIWLDAQKGAKKQETEGVVRKFLNRTADTDDLTKMALRSLAGMAGGYALSRHPFLSTAVGLASAGAPYAPRVAAGLSNNNVLQNPGTSEILKILAQAGNAATRDY